MRKRNTDQDGLGQPLVDDALYYVQDSRTMVGNCILWWRALGAGYACDLDDVGLYMGRECRHHRETDIPWPKDFVERRAIRHVRGDGRTLAETLGGEHPSAVRHLALEATLREMRAYIDDRIVGAVGAARVCLEDLDQILGQVPADPRLDVVGK